MSSDRLLEKTRLLFTESIAAFSTDATWVETCMREIEEAHSKPSRHYHNLIHLGKLANELEFVKEQIKDWPAIVFAIAYHDIVYNPLASNNEEKSAALAEKRLNGLQIPSRIICNCINHIVATKSHESKPDPDTNYFTDADLSILGADASNYDIYAGQVRKEFNFYPNLIYNAGRKKVLRHFLQMKHIFKTNHFREQYEKNARLNLGRELEILSK